MLSPAGWFSGLISFPFLLSSALGGREAPDADFLLGWELVAKLVQPAHSQFVSIQTLSPRVRRVLWQGWSGEEDTFILQTSGSIHDHGDDSRQQQPEEALQGHEMILSRRSARAHLWEQCVLYENPGPDFYILSTQLQRGPWEAARVSRLFTELIAFVEHAHREGVNLAPIGLENVLVGPEGKGFKLVGLKYAGPWQKDRSVDHSRILDELFHRVMELCNLSREDLPLVFGNV